MVYMMCVVCVTFVCAICVLCYRVLLLLCVRVVVVLRCYVDVWGCECAVIRLYGCVAV